jgi:FAD/FMN-containing dehydrogenase
MEIRMAKQENSISIPELRSALNGRVIAPGDDGYDAARAVFYGGVDRRPAAIVRVADTADVARVVEIARQAGLELAVRSGGHSGAGHSTTEGGILLDLHDMKKIDIDARAARRGPRRA